MPTSTCISECLLRAAYIFDVNASRWYSQMENPRGRHIVFVGFEMIEREISPIVLSDSKKATNEMRQFDEKKEFDDFHKALCVRTSASRTSELLWAAHSCGGGSNTCIPEKETGKELLFANFGKRRSPKVRKGFTII